jgi:hypothetical protein
VDVGQIERMDELTVAQAAAMGDQMQADGMLAVIADHMAELVQDEALLRPPGVPVSLKDGLHILPFRSRTHDGFLHRPGKVTSRMAR